MNILTETQGGGRKKKDEGEKEDQSIVLIGEGGDEEK